MIQNDFFDEECYIEDSEECYIEDSNDIYFKYHDRDGAEFLAKSFFSYFECDVFSAPESNVIDFAIRKNQKFYTVQVKGSSFKKDRGVYQYQTRRKNVSYRANGDKVLKWQEYSSKDVQIFAFVANDIKKIVLQTNNNNNILTKRFTREDFFYFEKNQEYLLEQIIESLNQYGL